MNKFEQELKNNNFVCTFCTHCNKLVWPISDFCNQCFGMAIWKKVNRTAKLIEFSRKDGEIFCISEFEDGLRIMGNIINAPNLQIGQSLNLVKCDYENGHAVFILEPIY
jgi:uncharacterized OB-fold protein